MVFISYQLQYVSFIELCHALLRSKLNSLYLVFFIPHLVYIFVFESLLPVLKWCLAEGGGGGGGHASLKLVTNTIVLMCFTILSSSY